MPMNPRILEMMMQGQGQQRPASPWLGGDPRGVGMERQTPLPPSNTGLFGIDKDKMSTFSQAMLGLSSGLLSRGYGESGFQAAGRGIEKSTNAILQSRRQQRKKRARDYLKQRAQSATVSPEDAEMYGFMAELEDPSYLMGVMMQNRGANARASARSGGDFGLFAAKEDYKHRQSMERQRSGRSYGRAALMDDAGDVERARGGNPGALRRLKRRYPNEDFTTERLPETLDRLQKNALQFVRPYDLSEVDPYANIPTAEDVAEAERKAAEAAASFGQPKPSIWERMGLGGD